ncbi:MAG: hypothetical protein PHH04_08770 [Thomasclavelia sp.]|jgi:hypothetical protein|nr:hypothetical protein [Thomasclavelia sp.]
MKKCLGNKLRKFFIVCLAFVTIGCMSWVNVSADGDVDTVETEDNETTANTDSKDTDSTTIDTQNETVEEDSSKEVQKEVQTEVIPSAQSATIDSAKEDKTYPLVDNNEQGIPSYTLSVDGINGAQVSENGTDEDGNTKYKLEYDASLDRYDLQYTADCDFTKPYDENGNSIWDNYKALMANQLSLNYAVWNGSQWGYFNETHTLAQWAKANYFYTESDVTCSFNLKVDDSLSIDESKLTVESTQAQFAKDNPEWADYLSVSAVRYDEENHAIHVDAHFTGDYFTFSNKDVYPTHLILRSPEGSVYLPAVDYSGTKVFTSKACVSEHIEYVKIYGNEYVYVLVGNQYLPLSDATKLLYPDNIFMKNCNIVCSLGGLPIELTITKPSVVPGDEPDEPGETTPTTSTTTTTTTSPKTGDESNMTMYGVLGGSCALVMMYMANKKRKVLKNSK